ncbi:hypothetical protein CEXT_259781 [Caerostris extrusa]|uniref:Uncharacterized protein n=1 Tax=Caerostris extrusa TaxID=172846 RepID=A0AAV4NYE2_CAEEX|nr:hypothetical protein CEXT_259781 [Caerostris extrusa]
MLSILAKNLFLAVRDISEETEPVEGGRVVPRERERRVYLGRSWALLSVPSCDQSLSLLSGRPAERSRVDGGQCGCFGFSSTVSILQWMVDMKMKDRSREKLTFGKTALIEKTSSVSKQKQIMSCRDEK